MRLHGKRGGEGELGIRPRAGGTETRLLTGEEGKYQVPHCTQTDASIH